MMPPPVDPPSPDTLLALVRIARLVLEAWPQDRPVPPKFVRPLLTFYRLANYHAILPADASRFEFDE